MTPLERAGHRIGTGLQAVFEPALRWPSRGVDVTARAFRWVGVALAAWGAWSVVTAGWRGACLFAVVVAVLAWRKGRFPDAAEEQRTDGDAPPQGQRMASSAEVRAWLAPRIWELIGEGTGVFVETLLDSLIADGHLAPAMRVTEFRSELERDGIPTRDQLHLGRVNRIGIHRDDLAAVVGMAAAAPPVPASDPVGP